MNNVIELESTIDHQINIWKTQKEIDDVRKTCANGLNDTEFKLFVQIAKGTGLNPFLREIWAVKYDKDKPANIFISRDGYRKSAQRHPMYESHDVDAVYSNDIFEVNNCDITHKYDLKDRGELVGAYCMVKRKNSMKPVYVFVELKEYSSGRSLWNKATGKPATMIKKVAESQGLRMAFQEFFAGTYSDAEFPDKEPEKKQERNNVIDHEYSPSSISSDVVNADTLSLFIDLIREKSISEEKVSGWLSRANVSDISLMKQVTVDAIISKFKDN